MRWRKNCSPTHWLPDIFTAHTLAKINRGMTGCLLTFPRFRTNFAVKGAQWQCDNVSFIDKFFSCLPSIHHGKFWIFSKKLLQIWTPRTLFTLFWYPTLHMWNFSLFFFLVVGGGGGPGGPNNLKKFLWYPKNISTRVCKKIFSLIPKRSCIRRAKKYDSNSQS